MPLREEQIERYLRHLILDGFGGTGQEKLLKSSVLVIGTGGLGSPACLYLAAAGVGRIGIVDGDVVEISNLQRQVIHHTSDLARAKVKSAAEKMQAINPDVTVVEHPFFLDHTNILDVVAGYDFVLDCTDGFPIKFLINDACVLANKPFNHAGVLRWEGQTMTCLPWRSASYRCVFRKAPDPGIVPSCAQAGVLGAMAGTLGTLQATEAVKYLLGTGELLENRLLVYDSLRMRMRTVTVKRDPRWEAGAAHPDIVSLEPISVAKNCTIESSEIHG
ncbi:MAG: HesA/MoeB/ThiF family protein [Fibrobacterota bacterium]|nr:HesA/MoeB/ThiF family protein [Fibrobacterota bacterium]QQS04155.1 MAG: HesA/MoeB/ThiF family protein [Fibrobacterota bacterium]